MTLLDCLYRLQTDEGSATWIGRYRGGWVDRNIWSTRRPEDCPQNYAQQAVLILELRNLIVVATSDKWTGHQWG